MRRLFAIVLLLATLPALAVPIFPVEVVHKHPHDSGAFTQGLAWHDGRLFESTGIYGRSTLREVELDSGRVLNAVSLDHREFGEGITVFDGQLIQLTWHNRRAHIYDLDRFERVGGFSYRGEGWGLTHDGERLIMSDGSAALRFIEPGCHRQTGRVTVTADGAPLPYLNALQYVDGKVYANVWMTTRIAEIDPATGEVTAFFELAPLLEHIDFEPDLAVQSLNGIAFDPDGRRLFVTGKLWPWLFEVKVVRDGETWP